jgi:hypothetical protein
MLFSVTDRAKKRNPDRDSTGGFTMQKDKSSQDTVLNESSQEQPVDKGRAHTAHKSEPGHMPQQPVKKDDKLQPLRKKSGF